MIKEVVIVQSTNKNGYLMRFIDESGNQALEVFQNFGSTVKGVRAFFGENRGKDGVDEPNVPIAANVE